MVRKSSTSEKKKSNWAQNNQTLVKVICYIITGLVVQIRSKNVEYFTTAYKTPPAAGATL